MKNVPMYRRTGWSMFRAVVAPYIAAFETHILWEVYENGLELSNFYRTSTNSTCFKLINKQLRVCRASGTNKNIKISLF